MNRSCQPEQRHRVYRARDELDSCPPVVAVDILPPDAGPRQRWTLEATLDRDGAPGAVTGILCEFDLVLRDAQPQGPGFRVVATA